MNAINDGRVRSRFSALMSSVARSPAPHAEIADAACRCVNETPEVAVGLTGTPGWGTPEIPGVFVPGVFRFAFQADAVNDETHVMAGQNGEWNTANAAVAGDPNLSAYMPTDADFMVVITGYEAYVTPPEGADAAEASSLLANLVFGLKIVTNPSGKQPITLPFFNGVSVVGEVPGADTLATIRHFQPLQTPMIARGVDWKNDVFNIVVPGNSAEPFVTVVLHGFAIVKSALRRRPGDYLRLAWLDKALRSYPSGVVGPVVGRMLAQLPDFGIED